MLPFFMSHWFVSLSPISLFGKSNTGVFTAACYSIILYLVISMTMEIHNPGQ